MVNKAVAVPKIIMQTWKTEEVPEKWQASVKSIKKYMPDWKHVLMTDEMNRKFIEEHFPSFLPYFDNFPYPIQRADAIRYAWLYINGGLYLDLDTELKGDISSYFQSDNDLFLIHSANSNGSLTNSLMAAKPRHPIWLEIIEAMKKPLGIYMIGKYLKVMNSTGPAMLNKVVKQSQYPFVSLPIPLFLPCSICDKDIDSCAARALIRPLEGGSWNGVDSKVFNYCFCNYYSLISILLILLAILVIWAISKVRS